MTNALFPEKSCFLYVRGEQMTVEAAYQNYFSLLHRWVSQQPRKKPSLSTRGQKQCWWNWRHFFPHRGAGRQDNRGFRCQLSETQTIGSSSLSLPPKIFGFWTLPWDLRFDSIGLSRYREKIKCDLQGSSGDQSQKVVLSQGYVKPLRLQSPRSSITERAKVFNVSLTMYLCTYWSAAGRSVIPPLPQ